MANLMVGSPPGPEVRDLQSQLNAKFRPTPLLAVDGIFGPKTNAAVRGFQMKSHLTPDGIVGPKTRAALAAAPSIGPSPGPGPAPNPVPPPPLPIPKPVLPPFVIASPVYVPQDKLNSCWFASAQMLIQWKRARTGTTDPRHPDPSESEKWSKKYSDNARISNAEIKYFAADMGFVMVPPLSPSPDLIRTWLVTFGPLWVNGIDHITVIVGIKGKPEECEVLVFDPADKTPTGHWRNLETWYVLSPKTGRDVGSDVEAVFLRLP